MAEKLKIYQIYYNQKTKTHCYNGRKWWKHYNNEFKLTPFFENQVINDLLKNGEHKSSEYFGVFSHDISKEITFKEESLHFNPENLRECLKSGHDVYSFQKRRRQDNIIYQAENYHKGIVEMTEFILNKIGYEIPKKTDKIVLFNHFVMKSKIYERYYKEMLRPAMNVMKSMDELHQDAKYRQLSKKIYPKFTLTDNQGKEYNHFPYHPFILERFVSVWLQYNKQLTFKHIF